MIFQGNQLKRLSLLISAICLTQTGAVEKPPALGQYDKVRTQFDGVTFEDSVTYLHLEPEQSVTLPLVSVSSVGQQLDFTFSFWFKAQDLIAQETVQFFSFESSVICYITDALSIMCDTPERQQLSVQVDSFLTGKWYFFNLAVTESGKGVLSINDKYGMIVTDEAADFYFKQVPRKDWSVCFGACDKDANGIEKGFNGSIREVVALNEIESGENANRLRTYKPSLKGYYRFAGQDPRMFPLEEFRESKVITSFDVQNALQRDMIPSDICPRTFKTSTLVDFSQNQKITKESFDKRLKENRYAYTMSLTAFFDSGTCVTSSFLTAQNKDCNIVLVDDVFMLFFSSSGGARFHFFAEKNYFESQSSAFFVPFNQWITIQMQMTHYDGYQIAVLDQNGDVLVNFARARNMQTQAPKNEFSLFSGLSGHVSRFIFTDKAYYLPKTLSGRLDNSPIIDISFLNQASNKVNNEGRGNDLQLETPLLNKVIPYHMAEYGQIPDPYPEFDGVTCNDDHMSMIMSEESSSFTFQTPPNSDWMSETSLNFWFKVEDWSVLGNERSTQTHSIFTMQSGNGFEQFWFVFFRGGELVIAPFGLNRLSEPVLIFSEFIQTNADDLGWWHLSCYYQFYAKVECTLHNQNLDITRVKSLLGQNDYFFPQYGLTATFGKSAMQTFPGVTRLLIKEVNYWSRKVMLPEAQVMRYQQVDPSTAVGLLIYFRLAQGVPKVFNFAEFNSEYTFKDTNPRFSRVQWQPDFVVEQAITYDQKSVSLVLVDSYKYHNVCPLYTYLKDGECYSIPVNQVRFSLFPQWNDSSDALDWLFTLEQSSYITPIVQKELQAQWTSYDNALTSLLTQSQSDQTNFYKIVSSELLRNEADYHVMGSVTNAQSVFKQTGHVNFVPNKCHWFEVGIDDAFNGYREINLLPGTKDFDFQLGLQQNPSVDCKDFLFFDSFKSVQFEFIAQTDDETYMVEQPNVTFRLESPSVISNRNQQGLSTEGPEVEEESRTAKDLVIYVTIPMTEQLKIPVWTDIKILMSMDWTSTKDNSVVETKETLFQNAMYTIKFAPNDSYLITSVQQNYRFVQKLQTFIMTANETTVFGLHPSQVKDQLSFKWVCPAGMEILCEGQDTDTLYIPWNRFILVPHSYSTIYQFSADITWMKPERLNETRRENIQVQWYNLQKPKFNIETSPEKILVTSKQQTEFEITGMSFDAGSDLSIYQIDWLIDPPLIDQRARSIFNFGKVMTVAPGYWEENQDYTITCNYYFKDEPSINGTSITKFTTAAPPKGGNATIFPDHGYLGEIYFISVDNFVDPVSSVFYNVFNSYDLEGTLRGEKLNNRTLPVTMDYRYKAFTEFPIIVEVLNTLGERVEIVLRPQIVALPELICTTELICPEDEASHNDTGAGRRLQNVTQSQNTTNSTNQTNSTNTPSTSNTPSATNKTQPGNSTTNSTTNQTTANSTTANSTTTNTTEPVKEPCKNVTTCIQPEFNFTKPTVKQEPAGATNQTDNQTVPDGNQTQSGVNGTRRLSTDNICTQFTPSSDLTEAMAAFDLTGEFCILDSILSEQTEQQVIEKLEQVADYSIAYRSENIEIASVMFNLENAAEKDIESLIALDVDYDLNTEALLWQFPQQPTQDFYMQAIALRTDSTQVVLRVIDSVSGQRYALKDLDGQAKLKFSITPSTYMPGQTVCQGLLQNKWESNVCLTEIDIENQVASCLCGLTQGVTQISFKNDMSLVEGASVEFLIPEVLVVPQFQGTSFFFMAIVSCVSFVGLLGSLIAWKFDRKDSTQINELSGWKLNLVMAVATKNNEPIELVKLRQSELTSNSTQIQIIGKVHPLFAPFTAYIAHQSRLLRFTAYHLQLNLFMVGCMVNFGPTYRANDSMRQELFLDSADVNAISIATIVGAFALLPIISEPISWLLSNKRCVALKALFILGCLIVNISTVCVAVWVCQNCPTANQYVLATSVFSGFFIATMGTNMLRSGLTAFAPISCLTSSHAKQLLKDLETVAQIDLTKFKIVAETEITTARQQQEASVFENSDKQILDDHFEKRVSVLTQSKARGQSVL